VHILNDVDLLKNDLDWPYSDRHLHDTNMIIWDQIPVWIVEIRFFGQIRYIRRVTLTSQNDLEWPLSQVMCMFNYDQFFMEMWTLYMKRKNWILLYALSDLELSKVTLADLGPQFLVSMNICDQQHLYLIRSLGDMSSDGRTDGRMDTTVTACSPEVFGEHKNN
jgi:hypothetical protein